MNDQPRNSVTVDGYWFHFIVFCLVLSVVAVLALSLYTYGERKHVEGYALGCQAERMRNPSQEYIENGKSFCWAGGNWYNVRPGKAGFIIVK